jgi:predicted branched-subunit amino acid permease
MAPVLRGGSLGSRLLGAQWVIDETTALVSAETNPRNRRTAFWVSGAILYASWNIGTLFGALIGSSIDPSDFGLDAAFPVMFTAMLAPHLRTSAGKRAALFGGVIAVVLAPFMPIGLPILVSAIGMLFGISSRSEQELSTTDGAP